MKDWLSVQDYLFESSQVGDWEGQEQTVAENLNELIIEDLIESIFSL